MTIRDVVYQDVSNLMAEIADSYGLETTNLTTEQTIYLESLTDDLSVLMQQMVNSNREQ